MSFPQPTRILAIRHGETAWNVDTRIQGHLDIPLNDTGQRQARRLAAALADEPLQAIYSSDLSRAHQTATALAQAVGLGVQPVAGLRERSFGHFEGRTFREIEAQWPDQAQRWRQRDPEFCPAGGESLTSFYARVIDQAQALAAAHPGETIDRDRLYQEVNPRAHLIESRSLDSLLSRLRSKVEKQTGVALPVQTFRNLGYRFAGTVRPS